MLIEKKIDVISQSSLQPEGKDQPTSTQARGQRSAARSASSHGSDC